MIKTAIKFLFRKLCYEIHCMPKKIVLSQASVLEKEQGDDFTRLGNEFRKYDVIKLHIGCGPRILKGWINIDLHYAHYKEYLKYYTDKYYPEEIRGDKSDFYAIDITKTGLPLPDNSVEVIFHEDFIEHLNQRDQIIFLAETLRVLKKGGIHRVNTPNLLVSMSDHSDFSKGISGVYLDEWNKHIHLNVLTPNILQEIALMVGYKEVFFNGRNQSKSQLIPLEYRPDPNDRPESGNIFADIIK
ncbi:MAG: hypothetical protein CVT88_08230 [Candidatus Altiarchaeales archaeon HGW-Altiarchaeales-1]|nr:MAG: hypothetical protein CVT88_08230 [Candidatus Altiarchaeales archaeon HGW-Altiarchaeales-1]PKP58248.1 MAG: hypothetical protein CVT89_03170 [Candidatus Altiarchaeales archaeon HGW-Altiarchaeales-2]